MKIYETRDFEPGKNIVKNIVNNIVINIVINIVKNIVFPWRARKNLVIGTPCPGRAHGLYTF